MGIEAKRTGYRLAAPREPALYFEDYSPWNEKPLKQLPALHRYFPGHGITRLVLSAGG